MKVLLTGASGFVGSHILDSLRARGIATAVLLRPGSNKRFIEAHLSQLALYTGSINDPQSLKAALREVTHVIHCAGCVRALRLPEFYEVNHIGTRNVVEAINQRPGQIQRLIHISSLAVGGPATPDRPAREDDPPHPVSDYGKSKHAGEQEVRQCKSDYVILRPPAVYGPRDEAFLPFFKAIKAHIQLRVGSSPLALSLVYVKDLAEAVAGCLTPAAAAGKTFYAASAEITNAHAMADEMALQIGTWTLKIPLPNAALWPVCQMQAAISRLTGRPGVLSGQKYVELTAPGWVCDPARLRQELGIVCPTGLRAGLAETLAWYRQHGWL